MCIRPCLFKTFLTTQRNLLAKRWTHPRLVCHFCDYFNRFVSHSSTQFGLVNLGHLFALELDAKKTDLIVYIGIIRQVELFTSHC